MLELTFSKLSDENLGEKMGPGSQVFHVVSKFSALTESQVSVLP